MQQIVATEGMKASPPVAVSAMATVQGWQMADWVALATVLYILMQAGYLGWKWYREYRKAEEEDAKQPDATADPIHQ